MGTFRGFYSFAAGLTAGAETGIGSLLSQPIHPFVHSCFHFKDRAFGLALPCECVSSGDCAALACSSGKGDGRRRQRH